MRGGRQVRFPEAPRTPTFPFRRAIRAGTTMTATIQEQKRKRATAFLPPPAPPLLRDARRAVGEFVRPSLLCDLGTPTSRSRTATATRSCWRRSFPDPVVPREEILAHGNKVRAVLFFAQDRLAKEGRLNGLKRTEKYVYQLAPVLPAF